MTKRGIFRVSAIGRSGASRNIDLAKKAYERGLRLYNAGDYNKSLRYLELSINNVPTFADALQLSGVIYGIKGRRADAIKYIEAAIKIAPDNARYYYNLALIYEQYDNSISVCDALKSALSCDPCYVDAILKLALHQGRLGNISESLSSYERLLELMPGHTAAWCNMGHVYLDAGLQKEAFFCLDTALKLDSTSDLLMGLKAFYSNYDDEISQVEIFEIHREFGRLIESRVNQVFRQRDFIKIDNKNIITVGFLSGDFRNHPVGYFFESVLRELDRRVIKPMMFSSLSASDDLTDRLKSMGDPWIDISGMDDDEAARTINAHGVDILIDLAGHTANGRLGVFARRPADIQVSWLGYYATTGLTAIDYFIVDPHLCDASAQGYFTEKLWWLPATRLCYTSPGEIDVGPAPCVRNGFITFGGFNSLAKITDRVKDVWAKVLHEVPDSRLVLRAKALSDHEVRERLLGDFVERGVAPERLSMLGWVSRHDYLCGYRDVDIALDTFPFTGGTTSFDSLWMGVPVVTLAGGSLVGRQSVSILMNLAMEEWIAESNEEFVNLAARHGANWQQLVTIRASLRRRMKESPLCDAKEFVKSLTAALVAMCQERSGERVMENDLLALSMLDSNIQADLGSFERSNS